MFCHAGSEHGASGSVCSVPTQYVAVGHEKPPPRQRDTSVSKILLESVAREEVMGVSSKSPRD